MPGKFYSGKFDMPASTGSQSITGIVDADGNAFTPVGLIFFTNLLNSPFTGFQDSGEALYMGFSDGTTTLSSSHVALDNVTTTAGTHGFKSSTFRLTNTAGTLNGEYTVTALNSGGFDVNWTTNSLGAGRYICFIAIGGSGVQCKVGNFSSPGSNGSASFTGVGFRPDCILFQDNAYTNSNDNITNNSLWGPIGFGCYAGAGGQVSIDAASALNGIFASNITRIQSNTRGTLAVSGVQHDANWTSLDADGATATWGGGVPGAGKIAYIAFKGISITCGTLTQPTSTGNASISAAQKPIGLIAISSGQTVQNTQDTPANGVAGMWFSIGAADGTRQFNVTGGENKRNGGGVELTQCCRYLDISNIQTHAAAVNASGGSTTISSQLAVTSFDNSGANLNWGTADSTQRLVNYMLFAANPSGSSGGGGKGKGKGNPGVNVINPGGAILLNIGNPGVGLN